MDCSPSHGDKQEMLFTLTVWLVIGFLITGFIDRGKKKGGSKPKCKCPKCYHGLGPKCPD